MGKGNSSEMMFLSKCTENDLVRTNTIFRQRNKLTSIWQHPRSKQWQVIEYVTGDEIRMTSTSQTIWPETDDSRTDQRPISSVIWMNLTLKKKSWNQQQNRKYNIDKVMHRSQNKTSLTSYTWTLLTLHPNIKEHWQQIQSATTEPCVEVLRYKTNKHQDWSEHSNEEWQQLIDLKREAFLQQQKHPKSPARKLYSEMKSKLHRKARHRNRL